MRKYFLALFFCLVAGPAWAQCNGNFSANQLCGVGASGGVPTAVGPPLTVPQGGLGNTTFTANLPLIGNGASAIAQGTRSGNTTVFVTSTGTLTNGHCVSIDGNGNFVDAGGACTVGGGGGTVSSGTATQVGYYATTGTTISGAGTLLWNNASSILTVDASGTSTGTINTAFVQNILPASGSGGAIGIYGFGTSDFQPLINLFFTNSNTSPNTQAAVPGGDNLGELRFSGSDGVAFRQSSRILASADATFTSGSSPGRLTFGTTPSASTTILERVRIDSSGIVVVGGVAAQTSSFEGITPTLQIQGTGGGGLSSFSINRWDTAVTGNFLIFNKSRGGGTVGTQGVLVNGDQPLVINANGSDGTQFQNAAQIAVNIDGTPGAGSMPGRITLSTTPSGSATATEHVRIDSSGNIVTGGVAAQTGLNATKAPFQMNGLSSTIFEIQRWDNSTSAPSLWSAKSKSGTIGTHAAVALNDRVIDIEGGGSDGTNFQFVGGFSVFVDGAVSSGIVPGRFEIFTANTSGANTEALRIDSGQHLIANGSNATPGSGTNTFVLQLGTGGFPGIGFSDTGAIGIYSQGSGTQLTVAFAGNSSSSLNTIAIISNKTSNNAAALTITPPGSSLALGTSITQTADGAPSASNYSGASGTGYALNNITISSDDMVILASAPAIGIGYGWAINHNFGGSNMRGARSAVGISANLTATSSASNQDREYVGSTTYVTTTVNDGGTNTGAGSAGSIFAENPFACICSSSATNYFSMNGAEVDISNRAGTVKYKFGWRVVLDSADNGQGVTEDGAFVAGGGGLHGGWKAAFLLDDLGPSTSPVGTNGCILCTAFAGGPYTIQTGIDFHAYTITGNALRTPNFQLDGSGNLSALTYSITGGSAGVTCSGTPTASFASSSGIVTHC